MILYNQDTAARKLTNLKKWNFENNTLARNFVFKDFQEAIAFIVRMSFVCEKMNHHPDWKNVYNKLEVRLNTHDAGGVTDKDFELAEAFEKQYSER